MNTINFRYLIVFCLLILLGVVAVRKCNGVNYSNTIETDKIEEKISSISLDTEEMKTAYAFGLLQSYGFNEYLSSSFGIDTLKLANVTKGIYEGFYTEREPSKDAYYAGLQIGDQIANNMLHGINYEIFGDDSTKTISLKSFMHGFIDGIYNNYTLMDINKADSLSKDLIYSVKNKKSEDNKRANKNLSPIEKNIVGKHLLSLQWISWEDFGTCEITKQNDGRLRCIGSQYSKENSDYLKLDGYITIISEKHLQFSGKIYTRVEEWNNGEEYVRSGVYNFQSTDNRKYWRMQEIAGANGQADYIDIYFQKK